MTFSFDQNSAHLDDKSIIHPEILAPQTDTQIDNLDSMNLKLDSLNSTVYYHLLYSIHSFNAIYEEIQKLSKKDKKEKPKRPKPRRDPVSRHILDLLLNYQIPIRSKSRHPKIRLAQFRVAIVLLYITGARVNEIKNITLSDIESFQLKKKISITQPKTGTKRDIPFKIKGLNLLKAVQDDIDYLFKTEQFLFLGASLKDRKKPMSVEAWIRGLNRTLAAANEHIQKTEGLFLNLKTHSFRAGYVTRLLKTEANMFTISQLTGHVSPSNILIYNHYLVPNETKAELNEESFDFDFEKPNEDTL